MNSFFTKVFYISYILRCNLNGAVAGGLNLFFHFLLFCFGFVEIAASFVKGLHFNTFGGNPLACAVASSVLDVGIL